MSSVVMCDFCGSTSRTSGETTKVELPRAVVPEALHALAANPTAPKITLDICHACEVDLAETLGEFIVRQFTRCIAPGDPTDTTKGTNR